MSSALSTPPGPPRLRRWLRTSLMVVCAATVAAVAGTSYWVVSLGPAPLGEGLAFSTLVVDRNGNLLRPYTTLEGRWRLPATRENVDPRFLAMLLAYEDRRFNAHHGVDPLALGRAISQLLCTGRVVRQRSGAPFVSPDVFPSGVALPDHLGLWSGLSMKAGQGKAGTWPKRWCSCRG